MRQEELYLKQASESSLPKASSTEPLRTAVIPPHPTRADVRASLTAGGLQEAGLWAGSEGESGRESYFPVAPSLVGGGCANCPVSQVGSGMYRREHGQASPASLLSVSLTEG